MSEPKLCPMTFNQPASDAGSDRCFQEKCAWWVEEHEVIEHHFKEE
jgi:hypothetical protein